MSKLSRGTTRSAAGKKKAKKRPDSRPMNDNLPSAGALEPVQSEQGVDRKPAGTVLQFRPRGRESAGSRSTGRAAGGRALLQPVDYGYVYTDLRIIGGLAAVLFGGLVALSFVVR